MRFEARQKACLIEALLAWGGVILANSVFYRLHAAGTLSADWLFFLSAFSLLNVPVAIYLKRRERILFLDSSLKEVLGSISLFLKVSLLIFPLAFLVNHFYQRLFFDFHYSAPIRELPWAMMAANRLLLALPEEFFFRGYLQGRLNPVFGRPGRIGGAPVGWSLVAVSLLFALSHSLIHAQWWHGFIFFPSLVFGWLQERRGTILAPTLFHAACNVFSDWAAFHYAGL